MITLPKYAVGGGVARERATWKGGKLISVLLGGGGSAGSPVGGGRHVLGFVFRTL